MRLLKMGLWLPLIFGLTFTASAAELPQLSKDVSNYEDRAMLGKLLVDVENAINAKDLNGVTKHMHPNVRVVWYDAKVSYGVKEVRDYCNRMSFGKDAVLSQFHTEAKVTHPATFYGNFAVASGQTQDRMVANGKELNFKGAWSASLVKENGVWLISSIHFSVSIFENAFLDAASQMSVVIAGVAFVVGGLLMWLIFRRK